VSTGVFWDDLRGRLGPRSLYEAPGENSRSFPDLNKEQLCREYPDARF